ncbi:MAG: hypothetical protein A2Y45_06015 [Tenericutes bacterium GWC2_34_14]|nr:MAG: hypothetical protein A2Z84_04210 [Tenericutes bacterium GWA2_35_7]OHE28510.1 MAG: hypothetical protein A2Y45_06015 [Tenericutes bacterium GWC2_34_14]OHE33582.1 MAG: hypothetical protein A2012_03795 [Tenericutes bacterium GWE2_34_108]OHE36867.1 MAG: hypothetical protein A2Y46_09595 [Tenericutes bacterium GWF1_35_14]OHE38053.1 MAG: hypothetical protein A2Y44_09070 [Tenericutes bacterium GWF2_35_184]OHE42076.1 MAG: hypothetical protein A3K26_07895 [Tenericutes bacterium RIFOXYA12_FULL_35_
MSKRLKVTLLVILALISVLVITTIFIFQNINKELEGLSNITIESLDLSEVSDGTYHGTYETMVIKVIVDVEVQNHQIIAITIVEHQNGQGDPADAIVDDVIEAQSLDVDLIVGATYSSRVILLAIEDALK